MFHQQPAPLGSLTLSALVALLPLVTIFVMLGVLRMRAHWAGLGALVVALLVAVFAFGMPAGLAVLAATEGAAFGLFPIMWIVFAAICLYQITVAAGRFDDLRACFNRVSDDMRVQAIVIAFCFGGLLEALAGFGAPVAITGVMLVALGFPAMRAASLVLIANTAPVAFGAMATPIITAGTLTGIPYSEIGAVVGRQAPLLAAIVPLLLLILTDGRRGLRQAWPVALVIGLSFAALQYLASNHVSVELTDIIASLGSLAVAVGFLRIWQPTGGPEATQRLRASEDAAVPAGGAAAHAASGGTGSARRGDGGDGAAGDARGPDSTDTPTADGGGVLTGSRLFYAFFPYLLVIVVFSIANLVPPVKAALDATTVKIPWPGLDGEVLSAAGKAVSSTTYAFNWLASPGTLLMICAVVTAIVYRLSARDTLGEIGRTADTLKWAILTVAAVLALAYVMNLSGQTLTIGTWIAGTGALFAFLSPILGWIGTAVTGSDTSANALFATLQQAAGRHAGIDPTLLVAANTSGGVVGKMISPQNLTIAVTAVGLAGREGDLFRRLVLWSVGLLLVLCVLIYLQSTPVLGWMV